MNDVRLVCQLLAYFTPCTTQENTYALIHFSCTFKASWKLEVESHKMNVLNPIGIFVALNPKICCECGGEVIYTKSLNIKCFRVF